jgi:opacity protein-like surface antigen
MQKLIMSLLMACGLAFSSVAQEKVSLFNAKELGLSLGTGYVVDPSAAFQQDYSFNLSAGAHYFLNKYIGIEANVPFYSTKGISVTEVQAGLVARLPIGRVAPYVGVSTVYNWNSETELAYIARAGLEFRFNPKVGVFAEGQYRNDDFNWNKGSTSVVGGIRFNF